MPFQAHDSDKWIKDILDQYDNKTLTRGMLIDIINEVKFESYKMGYEQHVEDQDNDNAASDTLEIKGVFDDAKQEWFGETPIEHNTGSDAWQDGIKVIENDPRKGSGLQGPYHVDLIGS